MATLIESFKLQLMKKGVSEPLAERAAKELAQGLTAATSDVLRKTYSLIAKSIL